MEIENNKNQQAPFPMALEKALNFSYSVSSTIAYN